MRVGVKYCGGCNPRYDRAGEYEKILAHFADDMGRYAKDGIHTGRAVFEFAEQGGQYDILLAICGCTNRCASTNEYSFLEKICISSRDSAQLAINEINHRLTLQNEPERM